MTTGSCFTSDRGGRRAEHTLRKATWNEQWFGRTGTTRTARMKRKVGIRANMQAWISHRLDSVLIQACTTLGLDCWSRPRRFNQQGEYP